MDHFVEAFRGGINMYQSSSSLTGSFENRYICMYIYIYLQCFGRCLANWIFDGTRKVGKHVTARSENRGYGVVKANFALLVGAPPFAKGFTIMKALVHIKAIR